MRKIVSAAFAAFVFLRYLSIAGCVILFLFAIIFAAITYGTKENKM